MASLEAGPVPTLEALAKAHATHALLVSELPRVRAAAQAWRNGLGGLLVALAGFSLVKGRSDITQLDSPWKVLVGASLLGAFIAGGGSALLLLRAAHGRPAVAARDAVPAAELADHDEALGAARALRQGIVLCLVCTALLVAAVGFTWYGPAKASPVLSVRSGTVALCGRIVGFGAGRVTLLTGGRQVEVKLADVTDMAVADSCP